MIGENIAIGVAVLFTVVLGIKIYQFLFPKKPKVNSTGSSRTQSELIGRRTKK